MTGMLQRHIVKLSSCQVVNSRSSELLCCQSAILYVLGQAGLLFTNLLWVLLLRQRLRMCADNQLDKHATVPEYLSSFGCFCALQSPHSYIQVIDSNLRLLSLLSLHFTTL